MLLEKTTGVPVNAQELIEFLMNRTEPSQKPQLTPPGWKLAASEATIPPMIGMLSAGRGHVRREVGGHHRVEPVVRIPRAVRVLERRIVVGEQGLGALAEEERVAGAVGDRRRSWSTLSL